MVVAVGSDAKTPLHGFPRPESADRSSAANQHTRLELQLAIVPAGRSFPQQPMRAKFDGGKAVATLPLPGSGLASGAYQVVARIVRNGMPVVEASLALIIPETPWLRGTVGRADVVLPPWTPLEVSTAEPDKQIVAIGCWGRSYEFQRVAFPSRITSAGEPLLAHPIALRVHRGDQDSTWQQQSLTVVRASPTTAAVEGVPDAAGPPGGNFKAKLRADYDGLMLIELSGNGPTAPPVQRLSLEISVRAERAIC